MKRILLALAVGILGVPAVHAACTKPSGRYVASGGGLIFDAAGNVTDGEVDQMSVRIPLSAPWKGNAWATNQKQHFSNALTFPATGTPGNSFNATTCHGLIKIDSSRTMSYVVSNRGKVIEMMLWDAGAVGGVWTTVFTLHKV